MGKYLLKLLPASLRLLFLSGLIYTTCWLRYIWSGWKRSLCISMVLLYPNEPRLRTRRARKLLFKDSLINSIDRRCIASSCSLSYLRWIRNCCTGIPRSFSYERSCLLPSIFPDNTGGSNSICFAGMLR